MTNFINQFNVVKSHSSIEFPPLWVHVGFNHLGLPLPCLAQNKNISRGEGFTRYKSKYIKRTKQHVCMHTARLLTYPGGGAGLPNPWRRSGGSRISPRRGCQPPGGPPTYNFAKFSQKLHEIERIWTLRGGARPSCPP